MKFKRTNFHFVIGFVLFCFLVSCHNSTDQAEWTKFYFDLENNLNSFQTNPENKQIVDYNTQLQLALLPIGDNSDSLKSLLKDSAIISFYNAKKMAWEMNYLEAENQLDKLIQNNSFSTYGERILMHECLILNSIIKLDNDQFIPLSDPVFDILTENFEKIDLPFKIFYLEVLRLKTKCLDKLSMVNQALSTIDFALYLLSSNRLTNSIKATYANLLKSKATIHFKEKQNETAKILFEKSIQILDSLNHFHKLENAKLNLANLYLKTQDTLKSKSLFQDLMATSSIYSPRQNMYLNNYYGNFLAQNKLNESAILYFEKSLSYFDKIECSRYKSVINLLISSSYADLDNRKLAELHLVNALKTEACDAFNQSLVRYYSEECKKLIYTLNKNEQIHNSYQDSILQSFVKERQMASKIWLDEKALHLDDYYTLNCSSLFQHISDNYEKLDDDNIELLLETIYDSKQREIKLNKYKISFGIQPTEQDSLEIEIIKILRQINDHKTIDDYENPIYENLYYLYEVRDKSSQKLPQLSNGYTLDFNLNLKDARSYLRQNDLEVIEYLNYGDTYWYYYLTPNDFKIGHFVADQFEKYNQAFRKSLESHRDTIVIADMRNLLLPTELINSKSDLVVLGDASLVSFPFEILLDSHRTINYNIGLKEVLEEDLTTLNNKYSAFAYSSKATFEDYSQVTIPNELSASFQECLSIASVLKTKNTFLGRDMTMANFSKYMDSDITHISTHAFSDTLNRLESYLFMRDAKGRPVRIYSQDILQLAKVSKFVNLSACDTGTGVSVTGEGTYSISRAFLSIGTESIIKTLWKIDDHVTKDFMTNFYKNWLDGYSVSEALHITKQNFQRTKFSHPYYWAGFVLEGNPNLYLQK